MWKHAKRHTAAITAALAIGLCGSPAFNAYAAYGVADDVSGSPRMVSETDYTRARIIKTARKYLGTPYVYGAKYGQTKTFDCSSFAKTVFAENNMTLPRVSRDQAKRGIPIKRNELKMGDLVFFTTDESRGVIGHVGIYVGNGEMIHTYGKGGVKYSRIDTGYWNDHYITARRVLND